MSLSPDQRRVLVELRDGLPPITAADPLMDFESIGVEMIARARIVQDLVDGGFLIPRGVANRRFYTLTDAGAAAIESCS